MVFFPYDTYIISNTLTIDSDNVQLCGPAVIKRKSTFTSALSMVKISAASNIVVDGLSIDGADTSTDYVPSSVRVGILVHPGCENITLRGLHVYDVYGDGLYVGTSGTAPINVKIRDCTIERCHRNGISITNGDSVSVIGCTITDSYQSGIDVEPNDAADIGKNIVISDNTLSVSLTHATDGSLNYYPRLLDCTSTNDNIENVVITGNTMVKRAATADLDDTSVLRDVIVLISRPRAIVFSCNEMFTNYVTLSNTYAPLTILNYGTLNGCGNVLRCDTANADGQTWGSYRGVYMGSLSAPDAHEKHNFSITISGNIYSGLTGVYMTGGHINIVADSTMSYPFNLQASTGVCVIVNGHVASGAVTAAADDATPTVLGATHLLIPSNTGATEITQLDNSYAGQQVTLIATSATNPSTITDGGNFLLSANWTPDIDDTITLFTVNGTTWREIARSAN